MTISANALLPISNVCQGAVYLYKNYVIITQIVKMDQMNQTLAYMSTHPKHTIQLTTDVLMNCLMKIESSITQ